MNNIKNRLYLWADLVYRDKYMVLITMCLIALLTFSLSRIVTEVYRYSFILDYSEFQQDMYYYNSLDLFNDASYATIDSLRNSDSIKDVHTLNYFAGSAVETSSDFSWRENKGQIYSVFAIYNLSRSSIDRNMIYPMQLIDGTWVESLDANTVILSEEAKDMYRVGDVINMHFEWRWANATGYEEFNIPVTVVGFVSTKEYVPYTVNVLHNTSDLSRAFSSIRNELFPIEDMVIDGYPKYYCISSVFEFDGREINFCDAAPNKIIIEPENSATYNDIVKDIENCGLLRNNLVSYNVLRDNYITNHSEELRQLSILVLFSVVTLVSTFIGIFIDWYTRKRSELAIHIICGSTLRSSILYTVSPYLLSIFAGTLIGSSVWIEYSKLRTDCSSELGLKFYFLISTVYLLTYAFLILIYYINAKRFTLIDLYKVKE